MTSRLETYRVSAYNTSKQSENKIHDDAVARRYGFSGGLVPGVDVMAYMIHLPVAKWGRAFLERGFIEARFVKPVYDGETAEVTGLEDDGVLTIEVLSRGQLCATGSASLPASRPQVATADYEGVAAVAERKPVSTSSYEVGQWLGTMPRHWAGEAAQQYLADIRETDPIYAADNLGHPGLLQRVMNKVLVRRQKRRRTHRSGEGDRQLREEGPSLRRAGRARRCQRRDAAGALPAHRDLPAARAGGGLAAGRGQPFTRSTRHTPRMRGIQYAAASRSITGVAGILDHPPARAMTVGFVAGAESTPPSPWRPGSRARPAPASAACRSA